MTTLIIYLLLAKQRPQVIPPVTSAPACSNPIKLAKCRAQRGVELPDHPRR